MKKLIAYFTGLGRKLVNLRDSPHAIAGGVAIGMFMGFTPLFGLKTALCLVLAYLLRCSKIAAVIAVTLHDIVAPFWPVVLTIEYNIGVAILGHFHKLPATGTLRHFHPDEIMKWMKWTTFLDVGLPLLVGSIFLSIPAAVISYAGMLSLLQFREKRHAARAKEAEAHRQADAATEETNS